MGSQAKQVGAAHPPSRNAAAAQVLDEQHIYEAEWQVLQHSTAPGLLQAGIPGAKRMRLYSGKETVQPGNYLLSSSSRPEAPPPTQVRPRLCSRSYTAAVPD